MVEPNRRSSVCAAVRVRLEDQQPFNPSSVGVKSGDDVVNVFAYLIRSQAIIRRWRPPYRPIPLPPFQIRARRPPPA